MPSNLDPAIDALFPGFNSFWRLIDYDWYRYCSDTKCNKPTTHYMNQEAIRGKLVISINGSGIYKRDPDTKYSLEIVNLQLQ